MARGRPATTPNAKSNAPSTKSRKRQLSSPSATPDTLEGRNRRQSKRLRAVDGSGGGRGGNQSSSSLGNTPTTKGAVRSGTGAGAGDIGKVTPKKSVYFEYSSDNDDPDEERGEQEAGNNGQGEGETIGYEEDEDAVSLVSSMTSESEDDDGEEDDDYASTTKTSTARRRANKTNGRKKKPTVSMQSTEGGKGRLSSSGGKEKEQDKELWRPGVKAGLGPGKAVFIEKPKPRSDGGIKYVPNKIHPNTMAFLGDLKKNNDREWMKLHDIDYRTSWKDWESFVESLTEKVMEKDDTIPELPPKDLVFRVYRDIRFSPDPTPYKPYFSAAWSRCGRKGPYAGYYVQIAPGGKTFVGSGLWMPEAAPLALLRRNIDRHPHRLKDVLLEPAIRKEILGGVSRDEKKCVKAFVSQNGENALKIKPKGYNADNPNIDLLKLKNFTIGTKLRDQEVTGGQFLDRVAGLIGVMEPMVTYLNSVIMPDDDNDEDDDDDDDEDGAS